MGRGGGGVHGGRSRSRGSLTDCTHDGARLGFPDPVGSEQYKLNVYVGDSGGPPSYGALGYFNLDDEGRPMLVFHPFILDDPEPAAAVTAHELLHVLQYSANPELEDWFWEATAV